MISQSENDEASSTLLFAMLRDPEGMSRVVEALDSEDAANPVVAGDDLAGQAELAREAVAQPARELPPEHDFEWYYRQYWARVFGLARHILGNPQEAEDAAQEAFIELLGFENLDRDPLRWLFKVVGHKCIDVLRSSRIKTSVRLESSTDNSASNDDHEKPVAPPLVEGALNSDPESVTLMHELLNHLLASMRDRERQFICAHVIDGEPTEKVAASAGVSWGTVRSAIADGRLRARTLAQAYYQ